MINLFDTYDQKSWDLHYSLIKSGYNNPTIAINDDGFLPDDVTSPFLFFTGFDRAEGRPIYFNEIEVPEYWEICANNNQGEIYDYNQKRGVIHFAHPSHQRYVKKVDWLDLAGVCRSSDHYNKYGCRYAQTVNDSEGKPMLTTYFNQANQEVLVENHVTGDLMLSDNNKTYFFKNRTELVIHYLQVSGFNLDRIFYNSLSIPFLISFYLGGEGNDMLFWHESISNEVPGNMRLILENKTSRQTQIVIQNREAYENLLPLLKEEEKKKVSFLGFQYPFKNNKTTSASVLILTNSDQIEGLKALVEGNPLIEFNIGALTEMSSTLLTYGNYNNVRLYPNISQDNVIKLFKECSIYLDINHGNEILSAVRAAFEHEMLIMAFDNTVHNRDYVSKEHIYSSQDTQKMIAKLLLCSDDTSQFHKALLEQKSFANVETIERYQKIIE